MLLHISMSDSTCSMHGEHAEWNEIITIGTGTSVPNFWGETQILLLLDNRLLQSIPPTINTYSVWD